MLVPNRFLRTCLNVIALLLIIYLASKVSFLLNPLQTIFNILIVPFMLAGFFYYLMRPIVQYLIAHKMNRFVAILFLYLLLGALTAIFFMLVWPTLLRQVEYFTKGAPQLIEGFQRQMGELQQSSLFSSLTTNVPDISTEVTEYFSQAVTSASNYASGIVNAVTSFVIVVTTVPFILYYMLKDGRTLPHSLLSIVPRRYQADGKEVLHEIDQALSSFIVGRMLITFLLGLMMFIGFLIIGLPYALLVTVVAAVLNLIPYLGPILGGIPAVIVAFTESPTMVVWALVVMIAAQQIENNVLSPLIYGKKMHVHPLTTILLLLVAGECAGILGIILCIPVYIVAKIILVRIYRLFLAEKVEELVE